MPHNKRQHFVPKFLLKNFASDSDGRQISLINLKRMLVVRGASLKEQCYRDYFYGTSNVLEKQLGVMEGRFAARISEMLQSGNVLRSLEVRSDLVILLALQRSRTLLAEEETNAMADQFAKLMMYNKIDREVLKKTEIRIKEAASQSVLLSLILSPIM